MDEVKTVEADLSGKKIASFRYSEKAETAYMFFSDGSTLVFGLLDQPAELSLIYKDADGHIIDSWPA